MEITFDAGDAFTAGCIPLDQLQEKLKGLVNSKSGQEIQTINFGTNGYCTDAVIKCVASCLKNVKGVGDSLREVNLLGCGLLTDAGLHWLADLIKGDSPSLVNIKLDGCTKVTDSGISLLRTARSNVQISAMATSLAHLRYLAVTHGCPLLFDPISHSLEEQKQAQLLVVPLKTKESLAAYLTGGKAGTRGPLHYLPHAPLSGWTLNMLEIDPQTPLFERLVSPNLTQVVIPFDVRCEVGEVRRHVANTITLALSKEMINPPHPLQRASAKSGSAFINCHMSHMCRLSNDGTLQGLSDSQNVLGMVVSRQPLSRSNPYFEVECLGLTKPQETGIVFGVMHDVLMSDRFPMESKERSGGAVEAFEFEPGCVFGFGVEGEWKSEYVPSDTSEFYCTKDGVRVQDKKSTEKPHIGMHPILTVLGKTPSAALIKNYDSMPLEMLQEFEQKDQVHSYGFAHNMLYDENGVISYMDNYQSPGAVGLFTMGEEISKNKCSCTIKIVSFGAKGTITVGLGPERYPLDNHPGWKENSIALHGDDGSIYCCGKSIKGSRQWKVGDEVKVTVGGFGGDYIQKGDTLEITFYLNGEKVDSEQTLKYTANSGIRCVFMVGMHSKGEKAQLLNYIPLYLPQSPDRRVLTMGRSHFINIMDDGTLTYRKFDVREFFGLYMSKTPLSAELSYFEVAVTKLSAKKHMGVGFCHAHYPTNQMLGWRQGSMGYHADNGQLYYNSSSGHAPTNRSEEPAFGAGDVIGCGIDIAKAKVAANGSLVPQQTLTVYFTKNGKRIHERPFEYLSEGLYPAVNLHYEGDVVKLANYYSGPESVFRHTQTTKEEKSPASDKEFTEGCHFVVVGVGSDGNDPSGKTQLVQQAFDPSVDLSALKHVKKEIETMESNLGKLNLQAQQRYGQLLWQRECMERFVQNPKRISFHSLDTKTGAGKESVINHIVDILEMDLCHHPRVYHMHSSVWKYLVDTGAMVKEREIVLAEDLYTIVDHSAIGTNGRMCEQAVLFLQKKGYVTCLPWGKSLIALDMEFVERLTESVNQCPNSPLQGEVPALGDHACVWFDEKQIYPQAGDNNTKREKLLHWALQFFGVMRICNVRKSVSDPLFLFCTLDALGSTPVTLDDFQKEVTAGGNMVVMERRYHFLHDLTDSILAFFLTRCARSTQVVLLRSDGGVFQSGAVQTILRKQVKGQECELTLQSYCYMPGADSSAVNLETRCHVAEYTFNIFCLLADIIDVALIKLNIPVIVTDTCPPQLVNTSIGCVHDWHSLVDEDGRQTVCTLCNLCCEHGSRCPHKGLPTTRLRQAACGTLVTGCKDCGICKTCADEFWTIRSFLRPCCEVSNHETAGNRKSVSLNSTTFDEVTCTVFDSLVTPLCLKADGVTESFIQVFPGPAVEVPNLDRLQQYNRSTNFGALVGRQGDIITAKLDPLKVTTKQLEEEEEDGVLEIKPVYHTMFCREARVWHDVGIVCYESASTSVPVAQFVGERPLSQECNKFSFEIINEGAARYIAIGLCNRRYSPNRQPGWDTGSVGFHSDDGGIFLGSGWPATRVAKCFKGDVMACELDFERSKAVFYKNDTVVYTTNKLRIPAGGFFPCVGMHSVGEAVRLLQKNVWMPATEDEIHSPSLAFDCYKYGNMWISPGRKIHLVKKSSKLTGWVMLHNPSRSVIGYQVEPLVMADSLGTLKPGKTITFYIELNAKDMPDDETLLVKWLQLDSGREYATDDLTVIFSSATSESLLLHRLSLKIFNTQLTDITELKKVSDSEPDSNTRYTLEVFRNGISMCKYWLKGGSYSGRLPLPTAAILSYPKFPTLDTSSVIQRGMRLVAHLDKDVYAECVVASVSMDGSKVTLEYSEPNEENNKQIDVPINSPIIQIKEIPYETIVRALPPETQKAGDSSDGAPPEASGDKEDNKTSETQVEAALEIYGYSPRGNVASAKRPYMFVPFRFLAEGSQQAIKALDPYWLRNSLQSIAVCSKIPTRLTVQEMQITTLARKSSSWVHGNNSFKTRIGETFAFLPKALTFTNLCYPTMPAMFTDIDVHRLCMLTDQKQITGWKDNNIDEPIHFVDIPPIHPAQPLSDDLKYGCMLSGWTYTALVSKRILLPSYEKLFSGGKPKLPRSQLESSLGSLLSIYASLCHIYAEQCGGLEYQQALEDGTKVVNAAISHDDSSTTTSVGIKQVADPNRLFKRRFYLQSKVSFTTVCKAHLFSLEPVMVSEAASVFSLDHFDPYGETVNALARALDEVTTLPPNVFDKFQNLQVLILQECDKLAAIPDNIAACRQLEKLVIRDSGVKTLPADLLEVPELMVLELVNLPLTSLPDRTPQAKWLTRLTLSGLQLKVIPPSLGELTELVELDLNHNALTSLPMQLQHLQRLRVLHLCGMPWLTMEGDKSSLPLDKYSSWFDEHPYLQTYLGHQKQLQLFHEYDHNKNGMLDEDEIAALNVHLFWKVPRLGSNDINDEEYGGIPPVVFTLSALEELYLDFQAVTAVPLHMCRLQNLSFLSLGHNPLLESLPGSLGHLPSLKTIRLTSCPSLRTPPNEVVSRGFESIKAYLKRLAGGFTECRRTKLMFVGLGGAGKTSLLRALMSAGKRTEGTKGEDITDGIVIQPWTVKNDAGVEVTYSTWDFAGQTLYYNTHQFFLSKRAVYLLLWSTRQGFEHAGLDFWLSSVASHAPKTPIFVIGTHCDQVPKAEVPMADLKARYPQIAGFHFVSSVEGTGIAELEKDMLRVTLEQKNMGEKVPQVWLSLEKKILAARKSASILEWSAIKEYGMEVGIYDEKDTKEAIQFLHELGTVQYFDNDFLRSIVVINPQWIVNVMACVVSVKNSPIQESKGRLLHRFIPTIWSSYPETLHQWLLQLTEEFDLTFPLPKDNVNIVPCLLPQEEPPQVQSEWPKIDEKSPNTKETKMVYQFAYLPAGLFNRAQVRLFQFSDGKLIWKRGSLLKKNRHHALVKQISDCELLVRVRGPRPENIIFLIHEVIESLIEESFHGVSYDFLLPCPDCISKEETLEPSLFEGSLIKRAKNHRAPFLQCRKYFHTISMAQLQEVMPADSATDFDAHLQHSIMTLQQLNSAMAKDVAVLYSAWDIPAAGDNAAVHPAWIRADLEREGLKENYSSWFAEDIENTSVEDIMMAMKNCKLVVALVSVNFERDYKSNDLLMYTMDTLGKEYIIVAIGSDLSWMQTNLGMRIGKDELMVMVKTKDRYKTKVEDELLPRIKNKLSGIRMKAEQPRACFVSYCWANSRDAQSKGSHCPPEALGWGDPREIKNFLEDRGITCWLDVEQTSSGEGLFKNITQGMRQARVLVACVSDEYVKSDNCMMELRFGVLTLNLPLIICVVGTGREWKQSEVGILMQRSKASKIYFQQESESAFETLLTYVKEKMPTGGDQRLQEEAIKQQMKELKQEGGRAKPDKISFKEEYELTQRKFMRHIISYVSSTDSVPMPRLVVPDFDKPALTARHSQGLPNVKVGSDESPRPKSSRPGLRPKTATRTRERMEPINVMDDEEKWEAENFCLRLLCENEEGWHMCKMTYPIRLDEEFKPLLRRCASYLARLYAILEQSSVQLNCFAGRRGKKYREWIEENAVDNPNFIEAFSSMRLQLAQNQEADTFMQQLCRCHLPSGKTYWLCKGHQDGPRITKLSTESASRDEVRRVLFDEDVKLRELMEVSEVYQRNKSQTRKKHSIVLPAKMMTSFSSVGRKTNTKAPAPAPASEASKPSAPPSARGEANGVTSMNASSANTPAATPDLSESGSSHQGQMQRKKSMKTVATVAEAVSSGNKRREESRSGKANDKSKACVVQ